MSKTYRPVGSKYISYDNIMCNNYSTLHGRMIHQDTRNVNEPPSYYRNLGNGTYKEFKYASTIGISDSGHHYCAIITIVPWGDTSGGEITQIAYCYNALWHRVSGYSDDSYWNQWYKIQHKSCPVLTGVFPLIHQPISGTSTGTYEVAGVYGFKNQLNEFFPTRSGFRRTYRMVCSVETSDNTLIVYFGGYEVGGDCIWGSNSTHYTRTKFTDVTSYINAIGTGHCYVTVKNTTGSSGNTWYYLANLMLLIYDEPI